MNRIFLFLSLFLFVFLLSLLAFFTIGFRPAVQLYLVHHFHPQIQFKEAKPTLNGVVIEGLTFGGHHIESMNIIGSWPTLLLTQRANNIEWKGAQFNLQSLLNSSYAFDPNSKILSAKNMRLTYRQDLNIKGDLIIKGSSLLSFSGQSIEPDIAFDLKAVAQKDPSDTWAGRTDFENISMTKAPFILSRGTGVLNLDSTKNLSGQFLFGGFKIAGLVFQDLNITFDLSKNETLTAKTRDLSQTILVYGRYVRDENKLQFLIETDEAQNLTNFLNWPKHLGQRINKVRILIEETPENILSHRADFTILFHQNESELKGKLEYLPHSHSIKITFDPYRTESGKINLPPEIYPLP